MICFEDRKEGAQILTEYCAGILDPAQVAEVEAHVGECIACRKLVESQRQLWEALDAWKPVEVSPGFDAKLYERIARENAGNAWQRGWRRLAGFLAPAFTPSFTWRAAWKPALAATAAAAALLTIFLVRAPQQPAVPANPAAPMAQASDPANPAHLDVNQVVQELDDLDMLTPVGPSSSSRL